MKDQKVQDGHFLADFISFQTFVSSFMIQFVYAIGVVFITISGIIYMKSNVLIALLAIVVGNILWRLICEACIVLFQIHNSLVSIEKELAVRSSHEGEQGEIFRKQPQSVIANNL